MECRFVQRVSASNLGGLTPARTSRNEQIGSLNRAPQMAQRVLAQLRVEEDRVTYQFGKREGK